MSCKGLGGIMMKVLVIGGTRFFGIPMVNALLENGHDVTVATRGNAKDHFGDSIHRIILDHSDPKSMKNALADLHFDVVIDKIAYCSNDIKYVLDAVSCDRFIHMSSTAVYSPLHFDTKEEEFDGTKGELIWCNREDFSYDEVKRQAERAICQTSPINNWAAVRYPFVIGTDDYTKRLMFYVEHVMKAIPMYIDNIDCQMGFIRSDEAGRFLAFLAEQDYRGAVNGCSTGTISIKEILDYIEKKTEKKAVLSAAGDAAPYNGTPAYSISTLKAENLGFSFTNLQDWIYDLIDYYMNLISDEK